MDETVYNVVNYEDVRAIATDAASTAVDRADARTSEDLSLLADEAATAAVEDAKTEIDQTTQENMQSVADAAATKSLEGVQAQLDAQVETLQSTTENLTEMTVTLDSDQWSTIQQEMQVLTTASLLSLLVSALLVGVMLSRLFLDGWRR